MGGDYAPDEIVSGVVEAAGLLSKEDELILVGPKDLIESKIAELNCKSKAITVVDAPEVIGMDESPVEALRKKRKSSISIMAKMGEDGRADAVVSAGNTGACVAACQLRMRNLKGVVRPGITVIMPTFEGPVTFCDVGANVSCKPINLYQYAVMASLYAQTMFGIEKPRIALMGIGEEDAKGNTVVKKARELIKEDTRLTFVGNVEGRDLFKGVCDVCVCEGFVGNVILKLTEGLVGGLFKAIKYELMDESLRLAMKFKPVMTKIYKKYDYHEYGGALLMGVNGTALISHGSSKSRTIKNAIISAKKFHTQKLNEQIVEYFSKSSGPLNEYSI